MDLGKIRTTGTEKLTPDERKAGEFFPRLGYSFADAVADLIDNSIDAEAEKIHVRFVRAPTGIVRVIIADDGRGMTDRELREAMRFGSRTTKGGKKLGKYGIGLKSASLSQADTVTVLSRQGRSAHGRRWTRENVKKGWLCETLSSADVRKALSGEVGIVSFRRAGTMVIWEDLEHLRVLPDNIDEVLQKTMRRLAIELGIRFHRFLADGRLQIAIDQHVLPDAPTGIMTQVQPLDPFSYLKSGHDQYPATLRVRIDGHVVPVEMHIWPAKSSAPGYKLGGGKTAQRQGFYFYRNARVIQAGGWNNLRADDSEPHLSLARVKVDLPPELDSMFKLDVAKRSLQPPPDFLVEVRKSRTPDGIGFEQYLKHAETAYRRQKTKEGARFPFVPGMGMPARIRRAVTSLLKERGTGTPKKVGFAWRRLNPDEVFRIDAASDTLLLNAQYRGRLAQGRTGDAQTLKLALMFLLQDEFGKTFAKSTSIEWIRKINSALLATLGN